MKISEMTNDQASAAMIRLASSFSILCEDDEMMKLINDLDGKTWIDAVKSVIPKFVAFALSKHKNELYDIVGALTACTIAEVGGMNFMETVKTIRESWDEVASSFFPSSVRGQSMNGGASA